jgi:dTMP kinase
MHRDTGRGSGFFLTLEGPDGSGKSTQARLLAARLSDEGYETVVTREPGGTALGEAVREIVLQSPRLAPTPEADALLFNAARAQLVHEVVEPALAGGDVVICDRYADSTLAYQGYGSGRPIEGLRALGSFATGGLVPDLTILLDLPVAAGLSRKAGPEANRFELHRDVEFHERVRRGFLQMARDEPRRFVVVDATHPQEEIQRRILEAVLPRLRGLRLAGRPLEPRGTTSIHPESAEGGSPESNPSRSEPKARSARID